MSKTDQNENRAINQMVSRKYSSGYLRALEANIPVTYVVGSKVVREHNGKREVIAFVQSATKLSKPQTYSL